MNLNAMKRKAAGLLDAVGVNWLGQRLQTAVLFPFVRVVNYHDIKAEQAENFELHLQYYAANFANVDESALRTFLEDGTWQRPKPGLILSFDDGMRSHFEVAAPLLEKYGFTGWFFVPAGWICERLTENTEAAANVGEQSTLTMTQLRYLDKNHVVGCHTETHCRLSSDHQPEKLRYEVLGAKSSLEEILGHDVRIFCWVGGEESSYSKPAAELIKQGYDLSFMTNTAIIRPDTNALQLQRSNVEAENTLALLKFQLSGIMDLIYYPKRRRVNRLTA